MATKAQKAKVGAFLLICAAGITVALVAISGYRGSNRQRYNIVFDSTVLGLDKGGLVQYLGVPVGLVDDIFVTDKGKARVEILIDPAKVQLREGVEATLEFRSLAAGIMCVALSGGSATNPPLKPGSTIPTGTSLVQSFSTQSADLLASLKDLVDKLKTSLEGMGSGELTESVRQLRKLVEETQGFVGDTRQTLSLLTDDIQGSMGDVKVGISKFNELADSTNKFVNTADATIKDVHEKIKPLDLAKTEETLRKEFVDLSEKMKSTADQFGQAAQTVNYGTGNLEHSLTETMQRLNETLEALRDLALYLQQDPSALIRGKGAVTGNKGILKGEK